MTVRPTRSLPPTRVMRSSTHPAVAGCRRSRDRLFTVVFVSNTGTPGSSATPAVTNSQFSPSGVHVSRVTVRGARAMSPASDHCDLGTPPPIPSARRRAVTTKSPVTSRYMNGAWKSAYQPLVCGSRYSSPPRRTSTRRIMLGHRSASWNCVQRRSDAADANSSLSAARSSGASAAGASCDTGETVGLVAGAVGTLVATREAAGGAADGASDCAARTAGAASRRAASSAEGRGGRGAGMGGGVGASDARTPHAAPRAAAAATVVGRLRRAAGRPRRPARSPGRVTPAAHAP